MDTDTNAGAAHSGTVGAVVRCRCARTCVNAVACFHGKPHALFPECIEPNTCYDFSDGRGGCNARVWCEVAPNARPHAPERSDGSVQADVGGSECPG